MCWPLALAMPPSLLKCCIVDYVELRGRGPNQLSNLTNLGPGNKRRFCFLLFWFSKETIARFIIHFARARRKTRHEEKAPTKVKNNECVGSWHLPCHLLYSNVALQIALAMQLLKANTLCGFDLICNICNFIYTFV